MNESVTTDGDRIIEPERIVFVITYLTPTNCYPGEQYTVVASCIGSALQLFEGRFRNVRIIKVERHSGVDIMEP